MGQGFVALLGLVLLAVAIIARASPPTTTLGDDGMAKEPGPRFARPIDSPDVQEAIQVSQLRFRS